MQKRKLWNWDRAVKGMRVQLVNLSNIQLVTEGVISDVKRSNGRLMIDGKPVQSSNVKSVTVSCEDGQEITVTRAGDPQYQIFLK